MPFLLPKEADSYWILERFLKPLKNQKLIILNSSILLHFKTRETLSDNWIRNTEWTNIDFQIIWNFIDAGCQLLIYQTCSLSGHLCPMDTFCVKFVNLLIKPWSVPLEGIKRYKYDLVWIQKLSRCFYYCKNSIGKHRNN